MMTTHKRVYPPVLFFLTIFQLFSNGGALNVDGNWSPWSTVSGFCVRRENDQELVECGGGVVKKFRSCTNPKPQGSGATCVGESESMHPCNTNPCPLPIEFLWSEWTDCTARCGRGQQRR
eukprot:TRINITY_DN49509_c0_g1_i1.p1 TRINITY_DN49509_c0_g1~~TRINITY_DN49509_c0_g1_i1.p1  ORF type:complete len:120 (-),score=10.24 TRINITY_DN49509_c0_g1_i1:1-360(-)